MPGKGRGLQHLSHGRWKSIKTADWDSSSIGVAALLLDRNQVRWVASSSHGLYTIRNGIVDHFGSEDGLSGDSVFNLFEDHEGNIWAATTKGIDCFKDLAVTTFSSYEGLSITEVETVLASKDGTVWVGGVGGLDAIRGRYVESLKSGHGLPGLQVTSLFEDRKGRLLVGVDSTLSILKDGKFTPIKRSNGAPLGFVVGLSGDMEDNIWAEISGSPRELLRVVDSQVAQIFQAPEMPAARRAAIGSDGSIWLGLLTGELADHVTDDALTEKEIAVLQRVATGNFNKIIASQLSVSEATVKGHLKSILSKLAANDRTHAVTIAIKRGFLDG
jgi:DNA-binding CsgD family transcriptional regulator/ligand-binding sensor domain-containing protein